MGAEIALSSAGGPGRFTRRTELTLFLVPMAFAVALAQVAKAIWPTLLAEAPWTLLVMSVSATRALLVQPLVHPTVFFTLAIARPLIMAPVYYYFGRRYGDVALRWLERKLGPTTTMVAKLERYFRRFSYPLVAWSPTLFTSTMAGATGMRALAFFPLAIVGTVARVTILYFLGDILSAPLKDISDFVGRYQWYITPVTFALVAVQVWMRRRKRRGFIETVDEFDAELQETALELQSEATITGPPQADE
jgi:membrane protein DedA with SNARE-associated domain